MNAIRRIRVLLLQVTQAQFAAAAGVVQTTVSRWENGALEPSRKEIAQLLKSYPRLTADEFFIDVEKNPAEQGVRAGELPA